MINYFHYQILAIAILGSIACSLSGIFLVLRGVAFMSDAISHAILPGIVMMFLWTQTLHSPLLLIGATCTGFATTVLTERLIQSNRVKKETALGIVFPFFFSLGVILINFYTRQVHIDTDMVLLGELAFAPFNRLYIGTIDMGPYALYSLGFLVIMHSICLYTMRKEFLTSLFDPVFSTLTGFSPVFIHHFYMIITCITTVLIFNILGSVIVVALMLLPVAASCFLSTTFNALVHNSITLGILATVLGYWCAAHFDISIAGSLATAHGLLFFLMFAFAPVKGLWASLLFERNQKQQLALNIIKTHQEQCRCTDSIDLAAHLGWRKKYTEKVLAKKYT